MFGKFKYILHPFKTISDIINSQDGAAISLLRQNIFEQKASFLTDKTLYSVEKGVSANKQCNDEIIVSLTSYGKRIHEVYLAIESIMQGSIKPNRIVLWLSEAEFLGKILPQTLQNQTKRGLEIRFCKDYRSYKKLIPSLQSYPKASIITIDDDLIYNFDLVENLVNAHKTNSDCIWANRIHEITYNKDKTIAPYLQWKMCVNNESRQQKNNFFTTGGGVLFPPKSLPEETLNEDVFMKICPTADDIWFNAMARLKGTIIQKSFTHSTYGDDFIVNINQQADGLYALNTNPKNCQNDIQLKAVFEKYGLT